MHRSFMCNHGANLKQINSMSLLFFKKIITCLSNKFMVINDSVDELIELPNNANKTFAYSKKSTATLRLETVKENVDLLSIV